MTGSVAGHDGASVKSHSFRRLGLFGQERVHLRDLGDLRDSLDPGSSRPTLGFRVEPRLAPTHFSESLRSLRFLCLSESRTTARRPALALCHAHPSYVLRVTDRAETHIVDVLREWAKPLRIVDKKPSGIVYENSGGFFVERLPFLLAGHHQRLVGQRVEPRIFVEAGVARADIAAAVNIAGPVVRIGEIGTAPQRHQIVRLLWIADLPEMTGQGSLFSFT